jgi:hypothetical protein
MKKISEGKYVCCATENSTLTKSWVTPKKLIVNAMKPLKNLLRQSNYSWSKLLKKKQNRRSS